MPYKCGQCNKIYAKECETQKQCSIHDSFCFSCKKCDLLQNCFVQKCSQCWRKFQESNMFYDVRCQTYLCPYQFQEMITDHDTNQIILKCGCREFKEHVKAFMANFCYQCMRKQPQPHPTIRKLCFACFVQLQKRQQQYLQEQKQESYTQIQENEDQLLLLQIQQQKQRLQNTIERKNISQFTYLQFKSVLLHQRQDQCLLCLQLFSLFRRPLMVCLQQHLICQVCWKTVKGLNTCPLCRQIIRHDKVTFFRERIKTLQLQQFMTDHTKKKKQLMNKDHKDAFSNTDHETNLQQSNQLIILDSSNQSKKDRISRKRKNAACKLGGKPK